MPTTRLQNGVRVDSMINWTYEFKPGLGIMASRFDKLGLDIRSFREPLKRSIQRVIAPSIGKNFLQGGRPESWEPLSEMTLPVKDRAKSRFPVEDPLMRSGLLFKTMQQLNIWTITTDKASIQELPSKIWYGYVHQAGTNNAGTAAEASGGTSEGFMKMIEAVLVGGGQSERGMNIPARPFAMIQEEDMDAIQAEWEIWMNERVIRQLGL
jgi:phage gpG-like protein